MRSPRDIRTDSPEALKRALEQLWDAVSAQQSAAAAPALAWLPVQYGDAALAFGAIARMAPPAGTVKALLPSASATERRLLGIAKTVATGTVAITPPTGILIDGAATLNKANAGFYLLAWDGSAWHCTI